MLKKENENEEISIRAASYEDIPLIQQLTFEVWPQTYSAIISKEQIEFMLDMMYSTVSLKLQMNESSQFIIICNNKTPVGFAAYKNTEKKIYKLDKIYILPSQQGKGTGKFAINYILQQISKKGGTHLQLQVNRENINAKKFYNKIGFEVIKEADFEIGNNFFMNDYVMEKRI